MGLPGPDGPSPPVPSCTCFPPTPGQVTKTHWVVPTEGPLCVGIYECLDQNQRKGCCEEEDLKGRGAGGPSGPNTQTLPIKSTRVHTLP